MGQGCQNPKKNHDFAKVAVRIFVIGLKESPYGVIDFSLPQGGISLSLNTSAVKR